MKFYEIVTSFQKINSKLLTAQCEEAEKGYNFDAPYSFRKIKYRKMIDHDMRLPNLIVNHKVIAPTDNIVAIPIRGLFKVFSMNVKNILEKLELPENTQMFEIKLKYKDTYLDYVAYYFAIGSDDNCINFEHSTFKYQGEIIGVESYVKLLEIEENCRNSESDEWIRKHKLVMKKNFNFDFFCINRFTGYYCSERFREKVNEQNLTGFAFKEIDVA